MLLSSVTNFTSVNLKLAGVAGASPQDIVKTIEFDLVTTLQICDSNMKAWTVSEQLSSLPNSGAPASPVGKFAAFPDVEAAPWYHAGPSSVLGDHIQYVRIGEYRHRWTTSAAR